MANDLAGGTIFSYYEHRTGRHGVREVDVLGDLEEAERGEIQRVEVDRPLAALHGRLDRERRRDVVVAREADRVDREHRARRRLLHVRRAVHHDARDAARVEPHVEVRVLRQRAERELVRAVRLQRERVREERVERALRDRGAREHGDDALSVVPNGEVRDRKRRGRLGVGFPTVGP